MTPLVATGLGCALACVLTACGGGSGSPGATANSPRSTASETGSAQCAPVPSARPTALTFAHEPTLTIARREVTATIVTNCGTIVASLDAAKAPHTVNSFAFLVAKHFFDNTGCHRLVTSGIFVLQCGDPTATGSGGPGYTIPDENLVGAAYRSGTLAMANTGRSDTGGSQFFFVYADTSLPPQYTPFGHVTGGLDVLRRIAQAGNDNSNGPGDGHPNQPVVIESFTVTGTA